MKGFLKFLAGVFVVALVMSVLSELMEDHRASPSPSPSVSVSSPLIREPSPSPSDGLASESASPSPSGGLTSGSPSPSPSGGLASESPSPSPYDGPTAEYPTDTISGSSTYTTAGLNFAERKIYLAMKKFYTQVANGTRTSTEFEVDTAGLGITVENREFQGIDSSAIMSVLDLDCSYEQYWTAHTGWSFQCRYAGGTNVVESITIKCEVHPEYAQSTPEGDRYYLYKTDPNKIFPAVRALQNAQALVDRCSGLPDYDKLAAYRDYICDQVEYNYDAYDVGQGRNTASRAPWHPISVFDNDPSTNVVCEGYAKAFKYLCELSGFSNYIDCFLVSGYINGDHMWNLMRINGQSYMVDLTGCDSEWGRFGDLFLAGAPGATESGFVIQCPQHDLANGYYYYATTKSYTYKDITKQVYGGEVLVLSSADF